MPVYPALFVVAWMVSLLTESSSTVQPVFRPLVIGVVVVLILQGLLWVLLRRPHLAALIVLLIELILIGFTVAALIAMLVLVIGLLLARRRRGRFDSLPWPEVTRTLNVLLTVIVVLVVATAAIAGALTPPGFPGTAAKVPAQASLPDIYLVLLDGYPRPDTLAREFGYDDGPFLAQMGALGFQVARHSHSNYNGTELTLASMLGLAQVRHIPTLKDPPASAQAQVRLLTQAINHARGLEVLRALGYEIVTVPSEVSSVTLYSADRVLDSGQATSFEFELLREGSLPLILPDSQRRWLVGEHRDRVISSFDRLEALATERADRPRFVLAHVMSPHAPISFGPNGEPRDAWPCFPTSCSIYDGGQMYGGAVLDPIRDQVAFLDTKIVATAKAILAGSAHPPVIVFFSDHGSRHDFDDRDEMLRSLFIANTPGRPELFPDDVTPVNLLPRLLNEYAGAGLEMATEESYLVDMRTVEHTGLLSLFPWPRPD